MPDCSSCHKPPSESKKPVLAQEDPAVCFTCHGDKEEERKKDKNVHAAFQEGTCTTCHASHTSNQKALLASNPSEE